MACADEFSKLKEDDIPGASLGKRKPADLKNSELKFWLRCRGAPAKGLKTKVELVKRVEEFIKQGKDQMIVDPDPDKVYTKRKENKTRKLNSSQECVSSTPINKLKYPSDGWGTCLKKMPMFTEAEMSERMQFSGKKLANKDNHSVPTSLKKAKTFLDDEYLHEIESCVDQRYFYFRAKCHHNFRISEPPHQLKLTLCVVSGQVIDAMCSCVAGKVGLRNHLIALMLKCCEFSSYDSQTTKDLRLEQDENPSVACSSRLQQRHQKGRAECITPQPVMDIKLEKTNLDDSRSKPSVKCSMNEARTHPQLNDENVKSLHSEMRRIDPAMGLSVINQLNSPHTELVDRKFGECPVGSYLYHQALYSEANSTVTAELCAIPRNTDRLNPCKTTSYPRFPLQDQDDFVYPRSFSKSEEKLVSSLSVDENRINHIERITQEQAECEEWKVERTYRFTASRFDIITKRQRNHDTFANSLMHPKPFSSKHVAHGRKYEPIALHEYEKYMKNRGTPVTVLKCGLVICKGNPLLAATPDAKVVDVNCVEPFGLAEVKCPQTKYHVTPSEACSDPNFCLERDSDGKCTLKRNHPYFKQVQGQLGVTGARWCDFIVYTQKGMHVERIAYDELYWKELEEKLVNYYCKNFIHHATFEFQRT